MSSSPANAPSAAGHLRWSICGLLFFSVAVNYIHRLTIGILKDPLSQSLGWSESDYGNIAAAFSFAYAFGYLLGGRMLDRWGVKRGLPIFVFLWSLAATAHGLCGLLDPAQQIEFRYPWFSLTQGGLVWGTFAAPLTVLGFIGARIALGLTQGGNFPGAIKTVAEWFPVRERALATGWFNTGSNVGAVICPLVVQWMYGRWGWQTTFYVTGLLGFVWVAVWLWLYESPARHPRLSPAELAAIREDQPAQEEPKVSVPWLTLLRHRAVWAYVLASIFAGPAWGFYQFFLPDFLKKAFQLNLSGTAVWTSVFFFLAAAGGVTGGWFAGKLLARGWSVNSARKTALLACALAVVPVCLAPFAGSPLLAVIIVGLAGSAHQGWSANLFSVVSDTMPRHAISSVVGLGGFMAYFTGGFVNGITGQILQKTGSYVPVFLYFSGMYLLSLLLIQVLVPRIGRPAAQPA
ncbi:MFS transporter [Oleiharenicola lentus]|uniref:MFS transporter n=1 Tax=Oleiharenicola lentus TaxID=2508720 RepID=A0A4Q1CB43_9BACT|nr:MFS transporter [Oleiharenicola lentus]RXK56170.1 MFS transporter [Oleiharenicola lentus]